MKATFHKYSFSHAKVEEENMQAYRQQKDHITPQKTAFFT
jgi:hypothetical protein